MVTVGKELVINRTQQDVFDFMSDPANASQWQSSNVSAEWTTEEPIGVGSTQHSVSRLLGRKIDSTMELTTWDPPNRYSFKVVSGPIPFEANIEFVPEEDGTKVTFRGNAEVGGFFKIAEGLVGKQFQKQLDTDWDALKLILETQ